MRLFAASIALLLAGCLANETRPLTVSSSFQPEEVAWFHQPGTNSIRGNALLRTVGGDVRTCAGFQATLIPMSTYALDRFTALYGVNAAEGGFAPAPEPTFATTDPRYTSTVRSTFCDSEGRFTFSSVPDGDYFVIARVVWGIPMQYFTRTEGGTLMHRVKVSSGQIANVVLTGSGGGLTYETPVDRVETPAPVIAATAVPAPPPSRNESRVADRSVRIVRADTPSGYCIYVPPGGAIPSGVAPPTKERPLCPLE